MGKPYRQEGGGFRTHIVHDFRKPGKVIHIHRMAGHFRIFGRATPHRTRPDEAGSHAHFLEDQALCLILFFFNVFFMGALPIGFWVVSVCLSSCHKHAHTIQHVPQVVDLVFCVFVAQFLLCFYALGVYGRYFAWTLSLATPLNHQLQAPKQQLQNRMSLQT